MKLRMIVLVTALVVACGGGVVAANVATATPTGKVTLCHLADGPAQAGLIEVAAAAAYNGHYLQHSADIIPPFEYQGETYSLNWTGSFPEECAGDGGTTTEDPPPTTTEDPPPTTTDPCDLPEANLYEAECAPPTDPPRTPPVTDAHKCKDGYTSWRNQCAKNDEQEQPNGSVIYGEQG